FCGEHSLVGAEGPRNGDVGVVPRKASFGRRIVIGVYLVHDFGIGFERAIAVRKPGRYVDLLPVVGAENDRYVMPECRRSATDVDRDINNAAARTTDQFRLSGLARLKMHAADRADGARQRVIFLDESDIDSAIPHGIKAPDFGKKAAG